MSTNLSRVTIQWHGYTEVVMTQFSFKCIGRVAWITPVNGTGTLPYPYDNLTCEREI